MTVDPNPAPDPRLADASWLRAPETQRVLAAVTAGGGEARIVGGAVRNTLMSRPVTDIDIATTVRPEDVLARAQAAGLSAIPTGLSHGTVTVIAGHQPFEVTTLRRDVETFGRHATVAFTDDWEEDARRRDFTLNALYAASDGTVVVEVSDDGVGGADPASGTGLRGLADRVEALNGQLRIWSAAGQGTRVRAEIPCG